MATAGRGTKSWGFSVLGGGPNAGFDSPFLNGDKLDAVPTWSLEAKSVGVRRQTLANNHVVQSTLVHALAPLNMRPDSFNFTVSAVNELMWRAFDEAGPRPRMTMLWPITDEWGLSGATGQRQKFFLSRTLPWLDISFASIGSELEASFVPNVGTEVVLTVIVTGVPTATEILVPDTIADVTDFVDAAKYTVETGDLTANGPGKLRLRYNPTRFGTLLVGRTVPLSNALTFTAIFSEALPLRRWEDSLL